ncbi:hypothetical protein ABIE77_004345 [Sinorhizobium fredii]
MGTRRGGKSSGIKAANTGNNALAQSLQQPAGKHLRHAGCQGRDDGARGENKCRGDKRIARTESCFLIGGQGAADNGEDKIEREGPGQQGGATEFLDRRRQGRRNEELVEGKERDAKAQCHGCSQMLSL